MAMPDTQVNVMSILLVTELNSSTIVETFRTQLVNWGYPFFLANNSEDALKKLSDNELIKLVFVFASGSTTEECKAICQHKTKPCLILLVDDPDKLVDDTLELVDDVLAVSELYFEKHLEKLVRLFDEKARLQRDMTALLAEITMQKRLNSEIEVLKNAIVRNVSHELRTPLLQVKSAVSLLKEEVSDEKLITYAENATARLETHVNNITMLGYSLDINIGPIILRDAVEYARRNLGRVWQRKSEAERIELYLDKDLPPIRADKQGLSTILQLLMDNALKFSNNPIHVLGRRDENKVYIAVRDFGIGIADDQLNDIFETFYQVDSSSTRRYGGAGVGLALVKLILDHHESDILVESEVGIGSTFSFRLPCVDLGAN